MQIAYVPDEAGRDTPAFPSERDRRRLVDLVAEIHRHERAKAARGRISIEDRALHSRARHILGQR